MSEYMKTVSDSLKDGYMNILRQVRIEKIR